MLLSFDYIMLASKKIKASSYEAYVGVEGKLQSEVEKLAAFSVRLLDRDVNLSLVQKSTKNHWIGVSDLKLIPNQIGAGVLKISTSGTTGEPKFKEISFQSRQRSLNLEPEARWLLGYAPGKWASFSVISHSITTQAFLSVPEDLSPKSLVSAAIIDEVTHIATTPSMLKLMIVAGSDLVGRIPLRQITLGGETTSQALLDKATLIWPNVRLTHVLATTETGDICSASDGLAGYPLKSIFNAGGHFTDEGELIVNGHATGDIWTVTEDRAFAMYRKSEIINVGGIKVIPQTVEECALQFPGVVEAVAFAIESPLLGQLVGINLVGSIDSYDIKKHFAAKLPKFARPVQIQIVPSLKRNDGGKIIRRMES
jgi:hypothetical protein